MPASLPASRCSCAARPAASGSWRSSSRPAAAPARWRSPRRRPAVVTACATSARPKCSTGPAATSPQATTSSSTSWVAQACPRSSPGSTPAAGWWRSAWSRVTRRPTSAWRSSARSRSRCRSPPSAPTACPQPSAAPPSPGCSPPQSAGNCRLWCMSNCLWRMLYSPTRRWTPARCSAGSCSCPGEAAYPYRQTVTGSGHGGSGIDRRSPGATSDWNSSRLSTHWVRVRPRWWPPTVSNVCPSAS
jgi:hypothetical protein